MRAVATSGYPLQTVVASDLRTDFSYVQEEWSYVDKDSGNPRTMDVLALRYFNEQSPNEPVYEGQVDAGLALLIECKQSNLPYIFFLSPNKPYMPDFPPVAGFPPLSIEVGDGRSYYDVGASRALSLDRHAFVGDATYSTAFAKCRRKGKGFEVSGEESFNNLVLPLSKALHHFLETRKTHTNAHNYICTLAMGVGVLDAPMVGITVSKEGNDAALLPWVRVMRHETREADRNRSRQDTLIAVDVVHKDFLRTYLDEHLFPFAKVFSDSIDEHKETIRSGRGPGLDDEPRLGLRK